MPLFKPSPILTMNLVLTVVVTAVAGLVWGQQGTIAAAIGALIGVANFSVVARLGRQAIAAVSTPAGSDNAGRVASFLLARLVFKMLALMAVIWLCLAFADLKVEPFALGLSVFVLATLLAGARMALGGTDAFSNAVGTAPGKEGP